MSFEYFSWNALQDMMGRVIANVLLVFPCLLHLFIMRVVALGYTYILHDENAG